MLVQMEPFCFPIHVPIDINHDKFLACSVGHHGMMRSTKLLQAILFLPCARIMCAAGLSVRFRLYVYIYIYMYM